MEKGKKISAGFFVLLMLLCGCGKQEAVLEKETEVKEEVMDEKATIAARTEPKEETESVEEENGNLLTWAFLSAGMDLGPYEEGLNKALQEQGIPCQVKLIDVQASFEEGDKAYVQGYIDEIKKSKYDIISDMMIYNCYDLYGIMAQEGLLLPWKEAMETEDWGQSLKEAYPERIWETLDYQGNIYGLLTPYLDLRYYAVFRKSYAQASGIEIETVTWDTMEEKLKKALELKKQRQEEPFVISTGWPYHLASVCQGTLWEMFAVQEREGKLEAVNLFDNPETIAHIKRLNQWGQEGLIENNLKLLQQGDFLVTGVYSYSPEAAENLVRETYLLSDEISLEAVELPEFRQRFSGKGNKTGVFSGSENPELAFQILAAAYSQEDIANAFVYGNSYQKVNGKAEIPENQKQDCIDFGNIFLTLPKENDAENKKTLLKEVLEEAEMANQTGFYADTEEIGEALCQMNILLADTYHTVLSGASTNFERDWQKLQEDLEELGMEQVLEQLNKQLEEWQKTK